MKFKLILVILFAILLIIFALQNTEVVTVKLWFWETNTSRALLIFLCIAVGIFIGILVPSPKGEKIVKDNN